MSIALLPTRATAEAGATVRVHNVQHLCSLWGIEKYIITPWFCIVWLPKGWRIEDHDVIKNIVDNKGTKRALIDTLIRELNRQTIRVLT